MTIELGLSNNAHSSENGEKISKYVDFRKSKPTVAVFLCILEQSKMSAKNIHFFYLSNSTFDLSLMPIGELKGN